MVTGGLFLIVIAAVIGFVSVLFPFIGVYLLVAALAGGHIALWVLFLFPILGIIVTIIGFVVRGKSKQHLQNINPGVKVLAFLLNYFAIGFNVIGLLFNAGVFIALMVLKSNLGL
jgi:hypothetical protein